MMVLRVSFFTLITCACIISPATAQEIPNFAPARYLCAGDMPLLGDNGFSAPEVADWNADGKKDLLVGVYYYGNIFLYLNEGTDEEPVFTDGVLLEADGLPISVGYG